MSDLQSSFDDLPVVGYFQDYFTASAVTCYQSTIRQTLSALRVIVVNSICVICGLFHLTAYPVPSN